MTYNGKPVGTLPEADSVTNADHILIYKDTDGKAYLAAGTLFRGDPATINGENVLTIAAGDNISLSQSGGTLTLSANLPGVLIFKGSATLATLPALTAANLGFTYNMTEAFTTTADFIEGAGKAYSAGVEVAVCDAGNGAYKYNALSIDLSGLVPNTRKVNGHALSADVTLTKSDIGLGNVDNTSDANKPVSTAQQAALNLKVDKDGAKVLSDNNYTDADKAKVAAALTQHQDISGKQDKLSVTGAANRGVYVSASGVVSAMTYELNKSVPANAVFTDTTYSAATTSADGLMSATDKAFLDSVPRDIIVTLIPSQSGSGDPSPTNVRPISGATSVTVTKNGAPVTVSMGEAGTVCGGTLNVTTGTLTVTYAIISAPQLTWVAHDSSSKVFRATIADKAAGLEDVMSSHLLTCANGSYAGNAPIYSISGSAAASQYVYIKLSAAESATIAGLNAWFEGKDVRIAYQLAAPVTYHLTAAQIAALPTDTVTSDAGTVSLSVRAVPVPASAAPLADGTAAAGTSSDYARADHVHPTDIDAENLVLQSVLPTNVLIADDTGKRGAYAERPAMKLNELLTASETAYHPAFLYGADGAAVKDSAFFGKYLASVSDSRAYSLPRVDYQVNVNFNAALQYCRSKGAGHHLITAAEWGFLALLAKKRGTMPKGNNDYGKDASESLRLAIPTRKDGNTGRTLRTATGTGPLTWSDTGDAAGVMDLNGNVWEWLAGMRLVYGELQFIPYNNAADPTVDMGATSAAWKALNATATGYNDLYITPDGTGTTSGSVKLDYVSGHWQWAASVTSAANSGRNAQFKLTTASGLSDFCKAYLQATALLPEDGDADYGDDRFYANNGADERIPIRGGDWTDGAEAGVFTLDLSSQRSSGNTHIGFRAAFVNLS